MKELKIGFIGAGNMGGALISGLIRKGLPSANLYIHDIDAAKLDAYKSQGINICADNMEVAQNSDVVILAIKPNHFNDVLAELGGITAPLFISIAPRIKMNQLHSYLSSTEMARIVRAMPNTPCLVGEGMTAVTISDREEDVEIAKTIFECVGMVEVIPEDEMDAVVALSGSSPAYVYIFIEALADAGVMAGLPKDKALRIATQAVKGSAAMIEETNLHPAILKDQVCSPKGTTIHAVAKLEECGFRNAIIQGATECIKYCSDK